MKVKDTLIYNTIPIIFSYTLSDILFKLILKHRDRIEQFQERGILWREIEVENQTQRETSPFI